MDELPFGSLNLVVLEKRVWAASSQARDSAVALRRPLDSLNVQLSRGGTARVEKATTVQSRREA
jgi:hypothetical protein